MAQVASGYFILSNQMRILILKAQANHFFHLVIDLRSEMRTLREDMNNCFEQVDKRFEKMLVETAKHFDQLTSRMDHFIIFNHPYRWWDSDCK
jgi:hypothetical protein